MSKAVGANYMYRRVHISSRSMPEPMEAEDGWSWSFLEINLCRFGWAVLITVWMLLGIALRLANTSLVISLSSSGLQVAFSGWTAVAATTIGGLPLVFFRPDAIPQMFVGSANALAAGMMLGAGLSMAHGLWENITLTGWGPVAIGVTLGTSCVAVAGAIGSSVGRGGGNRVLIMVIAFSADAFAEGLSIAHCVEGGGTVNLLVMTALIVHNIPEGLAICIPLTLREESCRLDPWTACLIAGCTSLPQPVIGILAHALIKAEIHPLIPSMLTGTSVGAVVWVALVELAYEASLSLGWLGTVSIMFPTTAAMLAYHELTET